MRLTAYPQEDVAGGIEAGSVYPAYGRVAAVRENSARKPRDSTLVQPLLALLVAGDCVHHHEVDGWV